MPYNKYHRYAKYVGSQGQDEGYHEKYIINSAGIPHDIEVYPPALDMDGHKLPWRVVWDGAVDYEGNKTQMLKRYPELKPNNVKVGSKSFKI